MSKAKTVTIKVVEPPKIPMNFGKKPQTFGFGNSGGPKGASFVAPKMRLTQSKGAGSGK